jgi:hypothetical protein
MMVVVAKEGLLLLPWYISLQSKEMVRLIVD